MIDYDTIRERVRGYTMLTQPRLHALYEACARAVPGDFVQCGVWMGGSLAVMYHANEGRTVWGFDTFEGAPPPTEEDAWGNRWYDPSAAALGSVCTWARGARFVKGRLEDLQVPEEIKSIAVLHIDADWYASTLASLRKFGPLVVKGGVIIVDDYGAYIGCRRAVEEYGLPVNHIRVEESVQWHVE